MERKGKRGEEGIERRIKGTGQDRIWGVKGRRWGGGERGGFLDDISMCHVS